jgi:hypothetical protein
VADGDAFDGGGTELGDEILIEVSLDETEDRFERLRGVLPAREDLDLGTLRRSERENAENFFGVRSLLSVNDFDRAREARGDLHEEVRRTRVEGIREAELHSSP